MTQTPDDPDRSLTDAQKTREDAGTPRPAAAGAERPGYRVHPAARLFVRGPWEMAATILIALGVIMLMQPFSLLLYSYSFIVTLVGTVLFLIVSHFPE